MSVEASKSLPKAPLVTTWPCLAEAMHLLGARSGYQAQRVLWQWIEQGDLLVHAPGKSELAVMAGLMAKYADLPMDLADASLISAAESLGEKRIFTLDQHFRVFRYADGGPVEVVPV